MTVATSRIGVLTLILYVITWLPLRLDAQTVALTFDDGFDPRVTQRASEWNRALLASLKAAEVRAVILPAAGRVNTPEGLDMVRAWGADGHIVGNHSYSHRSLADESLDASAFTADIARAEDVLRKVPGWRPWFRYPYLKEGDTAERRDAVRVWLREHGYRTVPVSIDASDWYYNNRFAAWRDQHPNLDTARYRTAYLQHLWDRANYYDGLSKQILGRSAHHVILLHTNQINAHFIGDVIALFRKRGWKIVDPQTALADPLYAMTPTTLPAGESILWALAKQTGVPGLRYPGESDVYEKSIVDALETTAHR